jgi:hypothetical protein
MSQHSQIVRFHVRCPERRAWVVATRDKLETHVVEMHQGCPSDWFANVELMAGEHLCRYYAGDDRNVTYYRPASVEGSLDCGLDALVSVKGQSGRVSLGPSSNDGLQSPQNTDQKA